MFRIRSEQDLKDQSASGGMSEAVYRQLQGALKACNPTSKDSPATTKPGTPRSKKVKGESKGEAAVRLALIAAFGCWSKGGEVVIECRPFDTRQFRADFALPRYRISAEVEGWSHHGRSLSDHHRDRERAMFFASHDWLVFPVSHAQALKEAPLLVDAIARAMSLRSPTRRECVRIDPIPHKHGVWHRMHVLGKPESK